VPVQGLDLLSQERVVGPLAEEHEELLDGIVDHAALLGFGLARFAGFGGEANQRPELR
jgi:hypothetical protein